VYLLADAEIISFEEAARDTKWKAIMDEEIKTIEKNKTYELVELPKGHKAIGVKWVYKKKIIPQGNIKSHKAKLIVKRYQEKVEIDYDEVFTLIA
jgi:Reverse transcriptase (RNA-dependent DNA polymerase)